MKRIRHAAESLITSNEIADQLVKYAVRVCELNTSSAVTIPVLESNGTVADHTPVKRVSVSRAPRPRGRRRTPGTRPGSRDDVDSQRPTSADLLHAISARLEQLFWMMSAENRVPGT
jgi:hypothetical protein